MRVSVHPSEGLFHGSTPFSKPWEGFLTRGTECLHEDDKRGRDSGNGLYLSGSLSQNWVTPSLTLSPLPIPEGRGEFPWGIFRGECHEKCPLEKFPALGGGVGGGENPNMQSP